MAPSRHHERPQKGLSKHFPRRRIRIYHDPYVQPSLCQANLDILLDKLGLWYAAKMRREMYLSPFVHGKKEKRKSCVDTITKKFTVRRLYCLPGLEAP